jgi:hypothetical protein
MHGGAVGADKDPVGHAGPHPARVRQRGVAVGACAVGREPQQPQQLACLLVVVGGVVGGDDECGWWVGASGRSGWAVGMGPFVGRTRLITTSRYTHTHTHATHAPVKPWPLGSIDDARHGGDDDEDGDAAAGGAGARWFGGLFFERVVS